jgi:ATP-dependent Clp protease protease subunit
MPAAGDKGTGAPTAAFRCRRRAEVLPHERRAGTLDDMEMQRAPEWRPLGFPHLPEEPRAPRLPVFYEPSDDPLADDVHSQLLARRVVLLTGVLDGAAAEAASARLLLLDQRGDEPINLHMSCPDGELDPTLALVATIDLIGAEVHAVAAGTVSGAAVGAFAAAGRRRAHPHTTFLLFEPKADLRGGADQLTAAAEQHRHQLQTLIDRIATACGRDPDDVATDLRTGKLLTAADAVAYGLVQDLTSAG